MRVPPMPSDDEPIPAYLKLRCCTCGYNLTGLIARRCPECGEPFDPRQTWLANEQENWAYHFEHVYPRRRYVLLGVTVLLAVAVVGLILTAPFGRFGIMGIIIGEVFILRTDSDPLVARCVYLAILVGVIVGLGVAVG